LPLIGRVKVFSPWVALVAERGRVAWYFASHVGGGNFLSHPQLVLDVFWRPLSIALLRLAVSLKLKKLEAKNCFSVTLPLLVPGYP